MRRLMISVLLLLALVSALWLGAGLWAQRALSGALMAPGAPLSARAVTLGGWPGAIALRLEAPRWSGPHGQSWQAPRADLRAALSAPNRLRLTLPPTQSLHWAGLSTPLLSREMALEARLAPETSLRLSRAILDAAGLRLGEILRAERVQARLAQPEGGHLTFDLTANRLGSALPEDLLPVAAREVLAGDRAELNLSGHADLDAPLDRHSLETPAGLRALMIEAGQLDWPGGQIRAQGRLQADAAGLAEGRITLRLRGWRALLPILVETGAVQPGLLPTIETAAQRLARPDPEAGPDGVLELPLVFRGGRVTLGPFPLGPAPRLSAPL